MGSYLILKLSIPIIFDICLTDSIIFFLLGTFGSISSLYGVIVTWKIIGSLIFFKYFTIGIGFLVEQKIN